MKFFFSIFSLVCFSVLLQAQDKTFQTYYEKSGYLSTPHYTETVEFCKKLEKASSLLHYSSFGKSPEGRDLPSHSPA